MQITANTNPNRRGMGAFATGLCIGGHDSGDGTPCTRAADGSMWSQAQLDSYNANLNPGVTPWTPQTLTDMAALNAARANELMPGSAPNALDRTVPVYSSFDQAATRNVISAPTGGSALPGNVVQNQGITSGMNVGANANVEAATDWITDHWPLLAAAAVALFFVTKGK